MAELKLLEHYKKMKDSHIMLAFQGAISQDVLVEMVEVIKNKFSHDKESSNVGKKIFSVFIEMAQNIGRYSAEKSQADDPKPGVGTGIIVLIENKDAYTIVSGNLVEKRSIPQIFELCANINRMNNEELKQSYKKQLKKKRNKSKEGAGLGLIDIARKSGNSIGCHATPVDDLNSFLVLSAKIHQETKNEKPKNR